MAQHRFLVRAHYAGGVAGRGGLRADGLECSISAAKTMGGSGIGTNPEELLLGAACNCYLITLTAIAARRGIPIAKVELESEVFVEAGERLRIDRIVHRPTITLAESATSEQRTQAVDVARLAESACIVSVALRGNVAVDVELAVSSQ